MTWTGGLKDGNGNPVGVSGRTEWDYVTFAGEVCPGIAKVKPRIGSDLDRKKPKGQKKTFTTDNGDPPVEFDIELTLQPDDFEEFRDFIFPILRPRSKSGGRDPLAFGHPMAQFCNVPNITIDSIDPDHPSPGGSMRVRIRATEWTPGPTKVKTTGKVRQAPPAPINYGSDNLTNGLYYGISSIPTLVGKI